MINKSLSLLLLAFFVGVQIIPLEPTFNYSLQTEVSAKYCLVPLNASLNHSEKAFHVAFGFEAGLVTDILFFDKICIFFF